MYEISKIGFVLQSGMGGVGGLFIFLLEESKSISHDTLPPVPTVPHSGCYGITTEY